MFWTVTLLQVLVNACRVFLVSVLFSGGTTSFVSGLSFIELSVAEVGDSISVSENEVCLYDSLSIGWKELCSDCYIGIWTDNVDSTVALIDGCSNVLSQSSAEGPRHDLCSSIDNNDIISESDSVPERPYLRCGLNEDHCVPVVDSISIENNELVLEFSDIQQLRYTEVDVNSTAALSAIFSFVPSLQPKPDHKNKNKNKEFGAITGRWSDRNETNKLTLTVSSEDGSHLPFIQAVYGAHASGSPISITPLLPPSHSRYNSSDPLTRRDFASARIAQCACSSVSTRMMQYGDFSVGVVDTLSKHVTSRVHRVTVSACLGDVLVWANEGSSGSVSSSDPALRVVVTHGQGHGGASLTEDAAPPLSLNAINGAPTPAVHWNGVLSLVGKSSMFQIPHDVTHGMVRCFKYALHCTALHCCCNDLVVFIITYIYLVCLQITGSWSLSFHILLLTGPTGAMRTVFYKGDYSGRDPNRTPSVWLMPNSNKLSIRVSSNVSTDVGVETISPLSSQQWTHVTFTFKNNTYEYQQRLEQFARKYDIPLGPVMPNGTSPSQGEADINSTANTCDENSEFRGNNTTIVGNCSDKELSYRDLNQTVGDNDGNGAVSETEVSATKDRDIFSLWRDHADFPRAPAAAATMHVYIDGKLDISVSYKDPLIGNNHALYMFKDISHAGPVGFVQDLAVFEGELSAVEVTSLYRSGFEKERKRKRPPRKGREPRPAGAARVARGAVQNGVAFMRHSEWFRQHGLGNIDSECDPDPDPDGDIDGETPPVHSFRRQDDEAAGSLLKEMQDAHAASCQYSPSERREFFADLVETWSHAPSLYLYGMMEGFGTEGPQNQCGLGGGGDNEQYVSDRDDVAVINRTGDGNDGGILTVRAGSPALSPLKALLSLLVALEFGIDAALVPLSTMLLSGVGVSEWLELLSMFPDLHAPGISRTNSTIGNSDGEFETYHEVLLSLVPLSDDMAAWLRQGAINERGRGTKGSLLIQMHWILVALLQPSAEEAPANGDFRGLPIATSALCWRYNCPAVDVQTVGGVVEGDTDGVTSIALGLLHLGAMVDDHEAQRILSHRYKHGLTVPPSVEVSAQYGLIAATIALDEFHKIGLTPIVEKDRIDETTDDKIDQGNTGNDDALIQAQIMRAEGGDVPALMATGDLYYYGARGLPRDQPRALDYFTRAETLGSTEAKCAMANMYLKGEGTVPANSKNVTLAIELYEEAAALGSVRGLNGLGYIYFYGQEVPKNESKAFGYFLAAAETGTDQDSLFNTAHCLEHGVGTSKDVERAVSFYTTAAQKFGNFGSVKALGVLYLHVSLASGFVEWLCRVAL